MPLPEVARELVPGVDFVGSRRLVRRLYVAVGSCVAAALIALAAVKVDIVVTGDAVIVPAGETARVQCRRDGVVQEILAREGDHVVKGQVLVRLDGALLQTRRRVLKAESEALAARLALLESIRSPRSDAFALQKSIRQAERVSVAAQLDAAQAMLGAREREHDLRVRNEAKTEYLVERDVQAKSDLDDAALRARVAEAESDAARAAIKRLQSESNRLRLEVERTSKDSTLAELSDGASVTAVRAEKERVDGDLAQIEVEAIELEIQAPRSGVVQGLEVHDRGDVLESGAIVARVVPEGEDLMVHVDVPSDGIAFVRDSQPVRVKLDAYPFQDFGVVHGEVARVADDSERAAIDGPRSPKYAVRVRLVAPAARAAQPLRLRPGMTGKAEFTVRRELAILALLRPFRGALTSVRN